MIKNKHNTLFWILIGVLVIQIGALTYKFLGANTVNLYVDGQGKFEEREKVAVPILLYHSILEGNKIIDSYTIRPNEFENDLKYIQNNGYTTVTMNDLVEYVYNGTLLPEKPIVLSFDDGYLNTYHYAYPLLKKYEMKAVLSIIGDSTDIFTKVKDENLFYSHTSWDQVNELIASGYFEIQNHTYALHTTNKGRVGTKMKKGESLTHYEEVLNKDIGNFQKLIEEKTGYLPNTFTYPYGAISKESVNILKNMGFKATLTSYGGVNYITRDENCLFGLKRNNRPRGVSSYTYFKRILKE